MEQAEMTGGFADAPRDAARGFRAAMTAMARPGEIVALTGAQAPAPVSQAAAVLLLVLCDPDTPVWLAASHDTPALRRWIAFHTGAPVVGARDQAVFALGQWEALLPLEDFAIGTAEYPDRSATLIVEVADLQAAGAVLRGPGIRGEARLTLPDSAALRANHARFPLGWDMFVTAGSQLAAVPRSTRVTDPEGAI